MSESEGEYYQSCDIAVPEQKTKSSRKLVATGSVKRKSQTPSAHKSKKTHTGIDVFDISKNHGRDQECNISPDKLMSFFVNRVANGCERRTAITTGEYYIDCKVYEADDARHTDGMELWKKALVRIKLQTDPDSPQWRKLQDFVHSVDTVFKENPRFYEK